MLHPSNAGAAHTATKAKVSPAARRIAGGAAGLALIAVSVLTCTSTHVVKGVTLA